MAKDFVCVCELPKGWDARLFKDRLGSVYVVAMHPEHEPRICRAKDLPLSFDEWEILRASGPFEMGDFVKVDA